MKKILCLFTEVFATGGIPRYSADLLAALSKNGYRVHAVVMHDRDKAGALPDGVSVETCGGGLRKLVFVFRAMAAGIGFRPAIILCGHIHFSPLCLFLKRMFKIEYCVLTYGIDVWDIRKKALREGLKGAKAVISISAFTAGRIEEQVPAVKEKILLLPCAVDGKRFYPEGKDRGLAGRYGTGGRKVILTVTRLSSTERRKGYDSVIKAMPRILEKVPEAVYVIVGQGDDSERVWELAEAVGVAGQVILAGYVPDAELRKHYNLCDVFVLPSSKEGFGIVFLEALACGKPVISGNGDAAREVLMDGELGLAVDPENVDGIAGAVTRVLSGDTQPEMRDPARLRERTLELYGKERFMDRCGEIADRIFPE